MQQVRLRFQVLPDDAYHVHGPLVRHEAQEEHDGLELF
jgi:hypothetical protein